MWELVQVTAQYSHAVLLAILPFVSDFSKKLDLPVPTPVMASQVSEFKCDPRLGKTGGALTLTNGFQFTFLDGRVSLYRSPQSYFSLQDTDLIPQFYGPVTLTEAQALNLALGVIQKLGYEKSVFNADSPPLVTPPEKIGAKYIPRFRFRWLDPSWPGPKEPGSIVPTLLDVEVNANSGAIEMVVISSRDTQRPSPKVDVVPPLLHPKPAEQKFAGGIPTTPVSDADASALLNNILPQLSDFTAKAGLGFLIPATTNQLILTNYSCRLLNGQPDVQLYLANGDRFNYREGYFCGFYAHDAFWKFPEMGKPEDFLGHINLSTNEAISLCEGIMKKLGYTRPFPTPDISYALVRGPLAFTRYYYQWRHPGDEFPFASFEVDMETTTIKTVYLKDPAFQKVLPKIGLPVESAKTN
jgi:hypothetical protein